MGTPIGPGKDTHGTLGPINGKAVGARTQFKQYGAETPKHGSGTMSIQGKNAGYKSTVDESLLRWSLLRCGRLGDEGVREVIHENFDEKECYDNGCTLLMQWSTRLRKKSVKDEARNECNVETDEDCLLFVNAEMLMIAARRHAV